MTPVIFPVTSAWIAQLTTKIATSRYKTFFFTRCIILSLMAYSRIGNDQCLRTTFGFLYPGPGLSSLLNCFFNSFPPFLLVLGDDFPTHASHAGLQAQAAHDLLEQ